MPDARRRTCKVCRRRDDVAGEISWRGMCADCGKKRMHANNDSIHEQRGPERQLRRYGIALKEFGPRWALIMKQAGEFDPEPVDAPTPTP